MSAGMSRKRNSHDLMDTGGGWLFHLGGITLNRSMLNAGNEHTYTFVFSDETFLTEPYLTFIYFVYEWFIQQI